MEICSKVCSELTFLPHAAIQKPAEIHILQHKHSRPHTSTPLHIFQPPLIHYRTIWCRVDVYTCYLTPLRTCKHLTRFKVVGLEPIDEIYAEQTLRNIWQSEGMKYRSICVCMCVRERNVRKAVKYRWIADCVWQIKGNMKFVCVGVAESEL